MDNISSEERKLLLMGKKYQKEINIILKSLSPKLTDCDIVLFNDYESCVGLKYNYNNDSYPRIAFIYTGPFCFYVIQQLKLAKIPYAVSKPIANSLIRNFNEGDETTQDYCIPIAYYYSELQKFKDNLIEDFEDELKRELIWQYSRSMSYDFKKSVKKVLESGKSLNLNTLNIEQYIKKIAKENGYKLIIDRNTPDYTLGFCLLAKAKNDILINKYLIISDIGEEILIGNLDYLYCVDINEIDKAVLILETLIKTEKSKKAVTCKEKYLEEFKISSKLLEIARTGIHSILDNNKNNNGIKYLLVDSAKLAVTIYIEKKEDGRNTEDYSKRMYEIVITYKEYLRKPIAFKAFIESPRIKKDWNFWCNEKKYKKEYFQ